MSDKVKYNSMSHKINFYFQAAVGSGKIGLSIGIAFSKCLLIIVGSRDFLDALFLED